MMFYEVQLKGAPGGCQDMTGGGVVVVVYVGVWVCGWKEKEEGG